MLTVEVVNNARIKDGRLCTESMEPVAGLCDSLQTTEGEYRQHELVSGEGLTANIPFQS